MKRPILILAFDEAHILTESVHDRNWSIYSELRRCLSQLDTLPIFTLFLSTAGKFRLFSPERPSERSKRIVQGHKRLLPPITETGFDQLALLAEEGQTTLEQVVRDEWIYRLGRPLYAFPTFAFSEGLMPNFRVDLPPAISFLREMIGFEIHYWNSLLTSCWVAPIVSQQTTVTPR
jgi:hypothetical protein